MRKNVTIELFSREVYEYMDILTYKSQLREFFTLSLDRCMKAVGAKRGSLFLIDGVRKELILEVAKTPSVKLEGLRTPLGERVVGKVALERNPLLVEDIDKEKDFSFYPRYNNYNSKSFLSVPLEFCGDLIGVVNITEKNNGKVFDDRDLRIVLSICEYLGIALYSLKRYLDKQKKINDSLKEEIEQLKKSVSSSQKYSSLGKVVGGLVHEINNPLDGALRYLNLALDSLDEESIVSQYLKEAKDGLKRIAKIIRSLLDFSWSLSSQNNLIDINQCIEESIFMCSHYISSSNIEIKRFLSFALPKIPDYNLKLAFTNIVKNACEAMKDGGTLTVSTSKKDNIIEIIIQDTGCGIPRHLQQKVFEPFFTTKSMGEGSGLGLAIAYEIVQRYKGDIFIRNGEIKGAIFIIHLPLV